jgi:hypothetical protein
MLQEAGELALDPTWSGGVVLVASVLITVGWLLYLYR